MGLSCTQQAAYEDLLKQCADHLTVPMTCYWCDYPGSGREDGADSEQPDRLALGELLERGESGALE